MFWTLSQPSPDVSESKLFKLKSDPNSDSFYATKKYSDKIKPIPLVYKKIRYEGDPKLIGKVSAKGYKYVSRSVVSGEFTIEILEKMKSSCLKLVRNIDFDPYLCDTSGLKSLFDVLKKFQGCLGGLSLIFRRFTEKDELKKFSPCLARLNRVKKLEIKFPNPKGIEIQDLSDMKKYCQKFCALKSVDMAFDGPKDVMKNIVKMEGMFANSHKIEKINSAVYFNHLNPSQWENLKRKEPRKTFLTHLKSVSIKFAFKTGWSSLYDGNEVMNGFQIYLQEIPQIMNPIHFSLTLDKMQAPLGVLQGIANALPLLTNLRFVCIELNKIKLTQFEMMILAKGFVECKQIEHLTFKYFDNINISTMDLLQFIIVLAKYPTFPRLDLFFRKLAILEWQAPAVKKQLDDIENITYVLTKQSIHVQKMMRPIEDTIESSH